MYILAGLHKEMLRLAKLAVFEQQKQAPLQLSPQMCGGSQSTLWSERC
jgi:hypothetical protein